MVGAQDEIPLMDCYTVWSGQCSSLRRVDVSSVLEYLAKSTDFCASSTIFSLDSGLRAFAKLSLHVLSVKAELDFFFWMYWVLGCAGFCPAVERRGCSPVAVGRLLTTVTSVTLERGP